MIAPTGPLTAETLRVLMAADSRESRTADRQLVHASAALDLAGESELGVEAVSIARELKPDVIAVSLEEPVTRGIRTIEALSAALPATPIVATSSVGDRESLRRAMLAGARDYLVRPLDESEFARAVLAVHEAERKRRASGQEESGKRQLGEIITLFGAKGGVGRTTLACNLAAALALHCKQRTVLVDLDLQFGDVALLLNVPPERSMAHLLPVMDKLDADFLQGFLTPHGSGIQVLPAPLQPEAGEHIHAVEARTILEALARAYDYVVVDAPRSLDDHVIAALDVSDQVYCVASNQLACLKSTRLCMEMMGQWRYGQDKIKLIINQAHDGGELPPEAARQAIDYPIFWKVPYDADLVAGSHWGTPFVQAQPKAKLAQNITGLACAMTGTEAAKRSLLSRLRGR